MPISDLCEKPPATIRADQSLRQAAETMRSSHVGTLVVVDNGGRSGKGGKPVGVVTDRDIVMKAVAEGRVSDECSVQEVMSTKVVSAKHDIGVYKAIELMEKSGVRRLVLVDDSDRLCGLVSTDDLVQMLGQEIIGIGRLYEGQIRKEATTFPEPHRW